MTHEPLEEFDRIEALPKIRSLKKQLAELRSIQPVLLGLKAIGLLSPDTIEAFEQLDEQERELVDLIAILERFAEVFGPLGWAIHDSLDLTLIRSSLEAVDDLKSDGEVKLSELFDALYIEQRLLRLRSLKASDGRLDLLNLALEDYRCERYYSVVLLLLTIIDGIVNDILPVGFFAENSDMSAWDSLAGHSLGLAQVKRIFNERRSRKTLTAITLPYRHGILHGRDLNYNNRIVAAKLWCALFAICDWGILVERGEHTSQDIDDEVKSPLEVIQLCIDAHLESQAVLSNLAQTLHDSETFKKRTMIIGDNVPCSGPPEVFETGSPEETLAQLMQYWHTGNYGQMAALIDFDELNDASRGNQAGQIRKNLQSTKLRTFDISSIEDTALATTRIEVTITLNGRLDSKPLMLVMSYHLPNEGWSSRLKKGGRWKALEFTIDE